MVEYGQEGTEKTLPFPAAAGVRPCSRVLEDDWSDEELYKPYVMKEADVELTAIPYCLWQNRGKGELQTWIPLK